uniref:Uncharacterized protein n=1 Tax=Musa acuminata TaxID=4641 RepID=Q1ENV2_MUSAC|nr:hypothetical protein MA4_82I11.28 [Musa acuminata]
MASSFSLLGTATDSPSFAYKPLHEYLILQVSNSSHLCELCTTLKVAKQPIPPCMVLFFAKCPACLEHHQVWLPMLSYCSNSTILTFVSYVSFLVPSLLVFVVPITRKGANTSDFNRHSGARLGARARRDEARAPRFMSRRLASKRAPPRRSPEPRRRALRASARALSRDFPDFPNPNTHDFAAEISSPLSLPLSLLATIVAARHCHNRCSPLP